MVKVEKIQSSIWKVFELLRDKIKSYEVILFFLILHKEDLLGCLYEFHPEHGPEGTLLDIISSYSAKKREVLIQGYQEFEREIRLMDFKDFKKIESTFDDILNEVKFEIVFERILFTLIKSRDYEKGEYVLPDEISELIVGLADIKTGDHVYNPFAGLASFGIKLDENAYYYGEEINVSTHTLGLLRLFTHGRLNNSKFDNCDSFISKVVKAEFNKIIASVPFGLRLPRNQYPDLRVRTAEEFFIKESIDAVNEKGSVIAHVSNGFLFRGGREGRLREKLLNVGLIEGVIQLPSNLMYNTSISSSILILSKGLTVDHPIKMFDASELYKQVSRTERSLDYNAIISSYNEELESDVFRLVKPEEVKREDYNLTVSRYFISQITNQFDGTKLKDFLKDANGDNNIEVERGKFISIANLNDHETGVYLDTENIEVKEVNQSYYTVSEPVLLIARVGEGLKPTIFKSPSPQYLVSKNIYAFTINENLIDPGYLVFELRKDYVNKQINKLQAGNSLTTINRSDFLKIQIELPSIEIQRKRLLETLNEMSKQQFQKFSQGLTDLKLDYYRQFQSTRHSVRQYLGDVSAGLNSIKKFLSLKEGEIIDLNKIVSKKSNMTLVDLIERTINSSRHASKKLDILELPFVTATSTNLDLFELLDKAKVKFQREVFEFKEDIDEESFEIMGENIAPIIQFNEEDFNTVFQNAIENFCEHGFKGLDNNIVLIRVKNNLETNTVRLEMSNNGYPFKKGFTADQFKIRGDSTKESDENGVAGNGGADINDIIKMHGAEFKIILDEDTDFPVTYAFEFPLKPSFVL